MWSRHLRMHSMDSTLTGTVFAFLDIVLTPHQHCSSVPRELRVSSLPVTRLGYILSHIHRLLWLGNRRAEVGLGMALGGFPKDGAGFCSIGGNKISCNKRTLHSNGTVTCLVSFQCGILYLTALCSTEFITSEVYIEYFNSMCVNVHITDNNACHSLTIKIYRSIVE